MRNIFLEGPDENYRKAKAMIDDIIKQNRQTSNPGVQVNVGESNPFITAANATKVLRYDILDKYVGLIIGKGGETLKEIAQRSNTKIFIPQKENQNPALITKPHLKNDPNLKRTIEIIGSPMEQQIAIELVKEHIEGYQKKTLNTGVAGFYKDAGHFQMPISSQMGLNQTYYGGMGTNDYNKFN